ncbi:MAG: CHASE2 domain-containing protein, partial [Planctomycetes bacterium]|nr:CHASE2 domain-containing protein [Planctomycetota bacterium]
MKKRIWATDWFAGLAVTLVFVLTSGSVLLQGLERTVYDFGVRGSERTPSDRVAVIAIDDDSIAKLGQFPWPRDIHAAMLDTLAAAGAKVVGHTAVFAEPEQDPGLLVVESLVDFFQSSSLSTAPDALERLAAAASSNADLAPLVTAAGLPSQLPGDLRLLADEIKTAAVSLNTDAKLGESVERAGNVVLAMWFALGEPQGNPDAELPAFVIRNALSDVRDDVGASAANQFPLPARAAIPPIDVVAHGAAAIGHLNANPDVDGAIRSEPLVVRYYDAYYPSVALQLAALSLNVGVDEIQVRLGEGVQVGRLQVGTDSALQMNTFFYASRDDRPAFPIYSFFDVLNGRIPPQVFADKVVLIGATATGLGSAQVTPISPAMAPVLTLAHSVSSILQEDFFTEPSWGSWAEWGVLLLVALYIIVVLPRMKAGPAALVTAVLLLALVGTSYGLLVAQAMWLKLALPATLLLIGHAVLTTKRFLVTEKGKEKSELESAESNRMLGLAYQGKGDLDMAMACFRRVPVDEALLDLVYNLALDFERKRAFAKAGSAYRYIAEHNPKFRDIETRMSRSKRMEDTVMLGSAGGGGTNATMLLDAADGMQKPMLGRYEVEKELGKGAMGVVYLGRDPKINRVVAIKTMALSQEFDADELDEVKERFFREAET